MKLIAFLNHMSYIIAPSSLAGRGLGVGFLYLTRAENRYIKGREPDFLISPQYIGGIKGGNNSIKITANNFSNNFLDDMLQATQTF
jgi:hypothetical protein